MERISDVFEFAVIHPDYWHELLSDSDSGYPAELDEAEITALEAARAHIDETVVAILHTAARKFSEIPHDPPFASNRPKHSATAKNRIVRLDCPKGRGRDLYYIGFWLTEDDEGKSIRLWPFLTAKKNKLEDMRDRLAKNGLPCTVDGYDLYVNSFALVKGTEIEGLAEQAASLLADMVDKSV